MVAEEGFEPPKPHNQLINSGKTRHIAPSSGVRGYMDPDVNSSKSCLAAYRSRIARTLPASSSIVYGFDRRSIPRSSVPLWTIALRVYPVV
jgi:hypothetical protein